MISADIAVMRFGDSPVPTPLRGVPAVEPDEDVDCRRLAVVGSTADLAGVLTCLMRAERLDVEVAHVTGWRSALRARRGVPQRVPLIRDDTGTVIVGGAEWQPETSGEPLHGEAVVDETVLFDGDAAGVRIEPINAMPGLRATVLSPHGRRGRWVTGRAAQLGTTGAVVVRDGVSARRPVKRSTFYRHIEGWRRVS